jgi:DNA-binding CsgD family transcriptional regulator/tetratricopeptide (TPR) repeat protein
VGQPELVLTESVEDYPAVTFEAATYSLEIHALEAALAILDTGLANLPSDSEGDLDIAMLYQLKGIVLFDLRELTGADYFVRAFNAFERLQDYDRAVECAVHPVVTPAALGPMVFWNKIDQGNTDLIRRALAFVTQDSDQYKWLRLYAPMWDEFLQSSHGDVLREFVKEAVETHSPELEAHTRMRLARWYFSVGQHESCRNEERRVKLILEKAGEPKMNRWFLFFSTLHYLTFGEPDEAGQSAREALVLAARSESRESIASSLHIATQIDFVTGDLTACVRHARENLDSDHGGSRSLFNEFSLVALMVTAYETGDRSGGDAHKAQLLEDAGDTSSSWLFIAPRMARITGPVDEPDRLLADLQSIPRHPEAKFNWYDMYTQIALAELAVYLSDTQIMAEMVEWFLPLRGSFFPGDVFGRSTDALLAELYEALGMTSEALSHYEDGLQFCRLGYLPELAWTSYRYARLLAENDDECERDRAPIVLDEGLAIATRLNMAPLKELMADLMSSVNHDDSPSPDGLSPREVEVLGLMAGGFTNQEIAERLFISPRTVAQHARNIFQKTGMANRAEATAYAFRHGLAE